MKKFFKALFLLTILFFLARAYFAKDQDVIYQVSSINSLLKGNYDGEIACGKLSGHGNFGIGTFDRLNGEMLVLDGVCYQIKSDGKVYEASLDTKTPFAVVTFFEPDQSCLLTDAMDYNQLTRYLDKLLPTKNIFYAIKIEGDFSYVKARSVPAQNKPYLPLVEIAKTQPVFESRDIKGALVGFRMPEFFKDINVPGYHFHFITADKQLGGHLLDCRLLRGKAGIDYTSEFHMTLPQNTEFYRSDLSGDTKSDLDKVEK